jgi:hypothetical protein
MARSLLSMAQILRVVQEKLPEQVGNLFPSSLI